MASIQALKNKNGEITSYRITVSLGRDSKGKKIFKSTTYRPQETAPTKVRDELNKFAVKFEDNVKNGTAGLSGDKLRLEDFVKVWEDDCLETKVKLKSISARTKEDYIKIMNNHVNPKIGSMKLTEIKARDINKMIQQLLSDGKSINTIRNIYNTLHACLDYAFRNDYIPINPCLKCESLPKYEPESDDNRIKFEPAHARRFLNDALTKEYAVNIGGGTTPTYEYRSISLQYRTFFTLALLVGCRRGELIALNWNDIDFVNKTIRIDEAVSRSNDGLYLKDPKTKAGKRILAISDICLDLLSQWKAEQRELSLKLGSAWEGFRGRDYDKNPIFIQMDSGKRMHVETPSHKFKKILTAYNETVSENDQLPLIRLHDLRHMNASLMNALGIDLKTQKHRLGHSVKNDITLGTYTHYFKENDIKAAQLLERELFPAVA